MQLGIIGDIHSNYEALTAAYDALISEGCEKIVCTGDIVGYGASPKECIDFVRERDIVSVRGNHDHYTTEIGKDWNIQPYAKEVIYQMQDTLDSEYINWLDKLPYTYEYAGVQFVHSTLEVTDGKSWPYILNTQSALFHFFLQKARFCFYGHTHIPLLFLLSERQITFEILTSRKLSDDPGVKYLLNPGSVGQPRDFDSRAAAVVLDTESHDLKLFRIEYDIESAQKKIIDAGLPFQLAERLSSGK